MTEQKLLPSSSESSGIRSGTAEFIRVQIALFLGGFSTFSLVYCVQPLLPLFSHDYGITPAQASVALSTTTGTMSVMLIIASVLSDRFGRRGIMLFSLLIAALLMIGCALINSFHALFVLRTLQGIALAGLPAIAMAYLAEEIEYSALGYAMGFYISGNALGGMSGRFITAWVAEHSSWQIALATIGVLALLMAIGCWKLLPPSRRFQPRPLQLAVMWEGARAHFRDARLPWLFLVGFLLMGSFISVYNYLAFRLALSPFSLSTGQIGSVFLLYIIGMFSSTWVGRMADRFGLSRILWVVVALMLGGVLLTLVESLWVVIVGVAILTFGFFSSHAVASSWVGRRAKTARGLASALYLWAYYFGSSIIGTFSGTLWGVGGWQAIVVCLVTCLALCLAVAVYLLRQEQGSE
ncbi:MAG: MFS transporter [Burkholderiales bacterium]|jgi:YNFM family putative membrane transporter|nr:MFS transporter [Burkholderiales bacterium]